MLYSDFAASGGVLGVALVDAVSAVFPFAFSTPDLPQPPPKFSLMPSSNTGEINMVPPDLPAPPPKFSLMPLSNALGYEFVPPHLPQPPTPQLATTPTIAAFDFMSPNFPQPTPPPRLSDQITSPVLLGVELVASAHQPLLPRPSLQSDGADLITSNFVEPDHPTPPPTK